MRVMITLTQKYAKWNIYEETMYSDCVADGQCPDYAENINA